MFWTRSSVQGLIPYRKCLEVIRLLVPSSSLWNIVPHLHPEAAEGLWLVTWAPLYLGDGELSSKKWKVKSQRFVSFSVAYFVSARLVAARLVPQKYYRANHSRLGALNQQPFVLCPASAGWLVWLGLGHDLVQVFSTCLLWFLESPRACS